VALFETMSLVVLAALAGTAQAGLPSYVEHKVCTFIVGKLEGDLNHAACDWIVGEATGIAAALLAETTVAEVVEDPLIAYVAHTICDDALSAIERHFHVGPQGICSDLGYGGRRRRSDAPAMRKRRTNATYLTAYSSFAQAKAAWTPATTERWIQIRTQKMMTYGTPVAMFPDSRIGYCFADHDTGAYTCMEPGYADQYARNSSAGRVATNLVSAAASGSLSSSPASNNNNNHAGLVATAVVFAVLFAAATVFAVVQTRRLRDLVQSRSNPLLSNSGDEEYASAH